MKEYKTIIFGLVALTVLACAYLAYAFLKDVHFSEESKLLAELEKYEEKQDYPMLTNLLYKKREGTAFSKAVIPWLEKREDQGFPPYLYALAMHHVLLGDRDKAILYYFRAGLIARIDLMKCRDASTEKIVLKLEEPFKDVEEYVKDRRGLKVSAGTLALVKEEAAKDRPLPKWLCEYGEKQLAPEIAYRDAEESKIMRELTRMTFQNLISERGDPVDNPVQ